MEGQHLELWDIQKLVEDASSAHFSFQIKHSFIILRSAFVV